MNKHCDEYWKHNIDIRNHEYRTDDEIEYDEAMAAKRPQLTDNELKARLKDEIETLVELGLD